MKNIIFFVFFLIIYGCAISPDPVVPSLKGKPRIKINTVKSDVTNLPHSQEHD